VNWFPEINELQTQADGEVGSLVQIPGQSLFGNYGNGPIRGMWTTSNGVLAVVSGDTVFRVGANGSSGVAGNLNTSTGSVSITDNGTQIMIGDGRYGYILSMATGVLTQIVADGMVGATTCIFQDGYFLANPPLSNQFSISGLYDGFAWDGADFAAAEGSPDSVQAIVSNMRQIWLFGSETTEVWFDSGSADFPFTRLDGAFIEYGCAAPFTAQKFDNSVVWLGGGSKASGVVWQSQGFTPKRISNHAVEYAIQQVADLSTTTAYTYQFGGHSFYALNLPDGKTTWVYDSATNQWSERQSFNNGVLSRHRGENHAFCYGKHLVGDYQNGNVYVMDNAVFTDNEQPIIRIRRSPHLMDNLLRVFYSRFQLDASVGVGLDGAPSVGANPQIGLSWSDDYGFTWSPEIYMSLGAIGAYRTRVLWNRLGVSRNRVFQVRVSDPSRVTLLGADISISTGKS
jgi:hypothetical protein